MTIADNTIGNGSRKQRLDSTEDGNGESWRHKSLENVKRKVWHLNTRKLSRDSETVADSLYAINTGILLQHYNKNCCKDNSNERSRYLSAYLRSENDNKDTEQSDAEWPHIHCWEILYIAPPFLDEITWNLIYLQSEEVLYLSSEDGYGYTWCEAHHDRVRYEFDNASEAHYSQEDEEHACHERGNGKSWHTILFNDSVDDDDESTRRATDLHLWTSKKTD